MKSICLNMIVKNESKVIRRCLASVKNLIDAWVIVDTGSCDGTQEIVRNCLRDIPGELHERAWVNFEFNRNQALDLARNRADYILMIDADEVLKIDLLLNKTGLNKDFYFIALKGGIVAFDRIFLINNHPRWRWEGVVHEALINEYALAGAIIEGMHIDFDSQDGDRSEDLIKKHLRDAQILKEAFRKNPKNSRTVYYLAQSYMCANEFAKALQYYQMRSEMGGMKEEVFWSLFCVGFLQQELKRSFAMIVESYSAAYQCDPQRLEPLYNLAIYLKEKSMVFLGYLVAHMACGIPRPIGYQHLQVQHVYDYSMVMVLAELLDLQERSLEACDVYRQLLSQILPESVRQKVRQRLGRSC